MKYGFRDLDIFTMAQRTQELKLSFSGVYFSCLDKQNLIVKNNTYCFQETLNFNFVSWMAWKLQLFSCVSLEKFGKIFVGCTVSDSNVITQEYIYTKTKH